MEQHEGTTVMYPIGSQCAITFSLDNEIFLLPAIVLEYPTSVTIKVLLLAPVTRDTVPCSAYFQQLPCDGTCQKSHGYIIPIDLIAPIESLTETSFEYRQRVWCKTNNNPVWMAGRIIDQLENDQWRIKLSGNLKRTVDVEPEYLIPCKSLLDEEGSSSSSVTDKEDDIDPANVKEEEDHYHAVRAVEDTFGSWQLHTTGFASKMMKKMGYVEVIMCCNVRL